MAERSDPDQQRLDRLRRFRNRRDPDLSLGFMKDQFRRDVERPFKQLGDIAEHWQRLVPTPLLEHTRLDGWTRGVLKVTVDSSPHLYQLDRLLRSGLQQQLRDASPATNLRRVKLRIAPLQ